MATPDCEGAVLKVAAELPYGQRGWGDIVKAAQAELAWAGGRARGTASKPISRMVEIGLLEKDDALQYSRVLSPKPFTPEETPLLSLPPQGIVSAAAWGIAFPRPTVERPAATLDIIRRAWSHLRPVFAQACAVNGYPTCPTCGMGNRNRNGSGWDIDHIIPLAKGGPDEPENLQLICRPCNLHKGSRLVSNADLRRARYWQDGNDHLHKRALAAQEALDELKGSWGLQWGRLSPSKIQQNRPPNSTRKSSRWHPSAPQCGSETYPSGPPGG